MHPYRDPVGKVTIGYGHYVTPPETKSRGLVIHGKTVPWRNRITGKQAIDLPAQDVGPVRTEVDRAFDAERTANQPDALTSFPWNARLGNLRSSTVLRDLNAGTFDAVPNDLMKWSYGAGTRLPGLVARRRAEGELWNRS